MAEKKKAETKAAEPKVKATKKAAGPEILGLHKFNPCRQYAAGRTGGSRPSERLFAVDEILRANGASLKDIGTKAGERWAAAAKAAGDKRSTEDLQKQYKGQLPVNASTMKYFIETMDLPSVVLDKRGAKVSISFNEKAGTVTSSFKQ
jgi:hypothetical protein